MKRTVFPLCAVLVVWFWWPAGPAVSHWTGRPAPEPPRQEVGMLPEPWEKKGYSITPLASYHVKALVLSREDYRLDRAADLSPLDLALGWSTMSEENVVKGLDVSQSGRWYHYHWDEVPPISVDLIVKNSSNHHLLPANETVRRALAGVRRHALVQLEGHLVEVTHPDGWKWRSSLTREDAGNGSCEILWVDRVVVEKP